MIQTLKRVLPISGPSDAVVECRQCGANVESMDVDSCPECGCSDLVEYRL